MNEKPMLACGCAANSECNGRPACAIHDAPEGTTVVPTPDLTGRRSRCTYFGKIVRGRVCSSEAQSSTGLPFFNRQPGRAFDDHYCGCYGWD